MMASRRVLSSVGVGKAWGWVVVRLGVVVVGHRSLKLTNDK